MERYGITSLLAGLSAGASVMIGGAQSSGPIQHAKTSRDLKLYRKSGGSQNVCVCGKPISANKNLCLACKEAKPTTLDLEA